MTSLKKKLDEFGNLFGKIIVVICILVWVVNIGYFVDKVYGGLLWGVVYYFKIVVAFVVVAIFEGLFVVVIMCFVFGMCCMVKKNVFVWMFFSVEILGCILVICSDKMGMLMCNVMIVMRMCVIENSSIVEVINYGICGEVYV